MREDLPNPGSKARKPILFWGACTCVLLGVLIGFSLLGFCLFFNSADDDRLVAVEVVLDAFEKIKRLEKIVDRAFVFPDSASNKEIVAIRDSLTQVERKILEYKAVEAFREKRIDRSEKRAEAIIRNATLLISAVSFIFGIFILAVGWLNFKNYREQKSELEEKIKERKTLTDKIRRQSRLVKKIEKTSSSLEEVLKLQRNEFNYILIEILREFRSRELLGEDDHSLRRKIEESALVIQLRDSNVLEQTKAVFDLSQLGTKRAIPFLNSIVEDKNEDQELRKIAKDAVKEIKERARES